MDEAISTHGRTNLLAVMGDFDGWTGLEAAKADFALGTHQYRQVEKGAFVSDKKRMQWTVKLMDPFTRRTKEKNFEPDQIQEAWAWVLAED